MRTSILGKRLSISLLFILMSGALFGQGGSVPPPRDPEFKPSTMTAIFNEDFETKNGNDDAAIPDGWSQSYVVKTAPGGEARWQRASGGGNLNENSPIRMPQNAALAHLGSRWNLLCYSGDPKAEQRLVTPPIDLSKGYSEPVLVFFYASLAGSGLDQLEVKYRFGVNGDFKPFPNGEGKITEETGWTKKSINLSGILASAQGNLDHFQVAFISKQRRGYGTAIDEVYVADMSGSPTEVKGVLLHNWKSQLPTESSDNPILRLHLNLSSGSGGYFLASTKFKIKLKNAGTNPITKVKLYRTQGYTFDTRNLVGNMSFRKTSNDEYEVTGLELTSDPEDLIKAYFPAGNRYYLWVAVDVNKEGSLAMLKGNVWVDVPKSSGNVGGDGFYFSYFRKAESIVQNAQGEKFNGQSLDYSFPPTNRICDELDYSIIFSTLFVDDFEQGIKWKNTSGEKVWNVGEPHPNPVEQGGFDEQPRYAVSGKNVLATSKVVGGKLVGQYPRPLNLAHESSWIETDSWINATYYKELYLHMSHNFNLRGNDKLLVEVLFEGGAAGQENWIPIWVTQRPYSMNQTWERLSKDISKYVSRSKFKLRLRIQSESQGLNASGIFIDDFRLIGDLIANDVGITDFYVVPSFKYGKETELTVKIKNLGQNAITKPFKVEFYIDGVKSSVEKSVSQLASGAEQEFTISGFEEFTPSELANNEHHVTAKVVLPADVKDDDETNNERTLSFYCYPTLTVTDEQPYPRTFGDPMRHWYAEPVRRGNDCSWLFGAVDQFPKSYNEESKLVKPFGLGVQLSSYIWTTGRRTCSRFEKSVLYSPLFMIEAAGKPKEFVMSYVLDDQRDPRQIKVHVEYSTDGKNWSRLEKPTVGWQKNWYENGEFFTEPVAQYSFVKVELPADLKDKLCQFRIVFENPSSTGVPGVAVNGVEVRAIRPDLIIESHTPLGECTPVKDEPLTFTVKNVGMVSQEAMKLPIMVHVKYIPVGAGAEAQEIRVMKNMQLPRLTVNQSAQFETDIFFPWTSNAANVIEVTATLMPERSEKRLADEDIENNTYSVTIHPKVPEETPLTHLQDGNKVFLSSIPGTVVLREKPQGKVGYKFTDFRLIEGTGKGTLSGTKFSVTSAGTFTLHYKVGDCELQVKDFEVAVGSCDLAIESFSLSHSGTCLPPGGKIGLSVLLKNAFTSAYQGSAKLIVRQSGRIAKIHDITNLNISSGQSHKVEIEDVELRSGKSILSVEVVVDNDVNAVNDRMETEINKFAFPKAPEDLAIYLQDAAQEEYMYLIDPSQPVGTYGDRDWNLYIPPIDGVKEVTWTLDGNKFNVEAPGFKARLADRSGAFQPTLKHEECGEFVGPVIHVKADDIEMLGLSGVSGIAALCATDEGYDISVGLRNLSRKTYPEGTVFGFDVYCKETNKSKTFDVALLKDLGQRSTITLPFGDQKLPTDFCSQDGESTLTITFKGVKSSSNDYVEDANPDNNSWTGKVRMSTAPDVSFAVKDRVIRKVFKNTTGVSYELEPQGAKPGYTYQWYSKKRYFGLEPMSGETDKKLRIEGIPADIYQLVVTNSAGCATTIVSEFVQTNLALTGVAVPKSSCAFTDNGDELILFVQNDGNGLLDNVKIKVVGKVSYFKKDNSPAQKDINSSEFSVGRIEAGTDRQLRVEGVSLLDLYKEAKGQIRITLTIEPVIPEPLVEASDDWDVDPSDNQNVTNVTEFGRPEVKFLLFPLSVDLSSSVDESQAIFEYDPKNANASTSVTVQEKEIQAYVSGEIADHAVDWEWLYSPSYSPVVLDPGQEHPHYLTVPTDEIITYCNQNGIKDKSGKGTYKVRVTEKNSSCYTDMEVDVYFDELDIKINDFPDPNLPSETIADITVPESSCDFVPNKEYEIRVGVQNSGSLLLPKGTELELTVTPKYTGGVYIGDPAVQQEMDVFCQPRITTVALSKNLQYKGVDVFTTSVQLYKEYKTANGETVNMFDGMSFEFEVSVAFVNTDKYKEKNLTNNTRTSTKVTAHVPVRIRSFTVKDTRDNDSKILQPGTSFAYEFESNVTLPAEIARIHVTPNLSTSSGISYDWILQGSVATADNESHSEEPMIKVHGLGKILLTVTDDGNGCADSKFIALTSTKADLMPDSMIQPITSCLDKLMSKDQYLSFYIRNVSNRAFNIKTPGADCPESNLTVRYEILEPTGNNNYTKLSEGKQEKQIKEVFGTETTLVTYKKNEFDTNGAPIFDYNETGQGLSGYGKQLFTMDQKIDFSKITKEGLYKVKITIDVGACGDDPLNNEQLFSLRVIDKPDMSTLIEDEYPFFLKPDEVGTVATNELDRPNFSSYNWIGTDGSSLGTGVDVKVAKAGDYTLKVTDKHGCEGEKGFQVKFPPYFQVVKNTASVIKTDSEPIDPCHIEKTHVEFAFKNYGRETLEASASDPKRITFNIDVEKNGVASPSMQHVYTLEKPMEEGATVQVRLPENKISFEQKGEYIVTISVDPSSDVAADKVTRDIEVKEVGHWKEPSVPDIENQATNFLADAKKKSLLDQAYNLMALPKTYKDGDPFSLPLYGKDMTKIDPTFEELEALGAKWTWMRNGDVVQEGTDNASSRFRVDKSNLPGKFKVVVVTEKGCKAESEEVELRQIVEYKLGAARMEGVNSTHCSESGTSAAKYEVTVYVKIEEADEPLEAGTTVRFAYETTTNGTPDPEHPLEIVTDREYKQGEELMAKFALEEGVDHRLIAESGEHTVIAKVAFTEKYSQRAYESAGMTPIKFNVVKSPTMPEFDPSVVHPDTKPYLISAPEGAIPATPGEPLSYSWTGPKEGSGSKLEVSSSGTYTLHAKDVNGCEVARDISVIYQFIITSLTCEPVDAGKAEVYLLDAAGNVASSTPIAPVTDKIDDNRIVRIIPQPGDGWKLRSIIIEPEGEDRIVGTKPTLDQRVTANFSIVVRFSAAEKTPGGVESKLLAPVVAVSPFDHSIVLLKTENVASYMVFDQLGKPVIQSTDKPLGSRIDIPAAALVEGVYLVRLVDVEGGVLTLKLIKQKR